ncbi:hypothetical protein WJX73_004644 [Symbiochloris irregularis]|uniref:N-acetyltransferase domain-containing protein n=1 Tax=Symbiochloris irregularis TaxID=706552 RepID=A0AAW1NJZ5_9CHLO
MSQALMRERVPASSEYEWAAAKERCIHCGLSDFAAGEFGPRTFVLCACCQDLGTHVECEQDATGRCITEESQASEDWYCSEACCQVACLLEGMEGDLTVIDGGHSIELIRYATCNKGQQNAVDSALRIFRSCFGPVTLDDGRDMLEMICHGFETPDDQAIDSQEDVYDFTGFRIVVLRAHSTIVTVATLRLFGCDFAEMPFVATREGHRRNGYLSMMLKGIEHMLRLLGVQYLVVPSVPSVARQVWLPRFGFVPLTQQEADALEDRILLPDPASTELLKKRICKPAANGKAAPAQPIHASMAAESVLADSRPDSSKAVTSLSVVSSVEGNGPEATLTELDEDSTMPPGFQKMLRTSPNKPLGSVCFTATCTKHAQTRSFDRLTALCAWLKTHGTCRPEWEQYLQQPDESDDQHTQRLKQTFTFKRPLSVPLRSSESTTPKKRPCHREKGDPHVQPSAKRQKRTVASKTLKVKKPTGRHTRGKHGVRSSPASRSRPHSMPVPEAHARAPATAYLGLAIATCIADAVRQLVDSASAEALHSHQQQQQHIARLQQENSNLRSNLQAADQALSSPAAVAASYSLTLLQRASRMQHSS